MPFSELWKRERKVHSQNGEDGVIEAIFERIGTTNKYFVEFGCADGVECNCAYLLELGWTGLMMDGNGVCNNPRATIHKEFITAENINRLFGKYDVPAAFDLLSIDIDGNDFWVWREIVARPRVVVIEYNASMPADVRSTIAYEPTFQFSGTDYFGASLLALKELGQRKGYTLIYCERAGANAFFLADEVLPAEYRAPPIETIYRPPNYFYKGLRWRPDPTRRMIDPFDDLKGSISQVDCSN